VLAASDLGMEAVWLEECRGSFAAMIADKQRREAAEAQSQAARAVAQPDELIDFVHLKARRPASARAPGRTRGRSAQRSAWLRRGVCRAPCAAARAYRALVLERSRRHGAAQEREHACGHPYPNPINGCSVWRRVGKCKPGAQTRVPGHFFKTPPVG